MTTEKNGGPAFPFSPPLMSDGSHPASHPYPELGMSLRDWFAGQALVAIISACTKDQGAIDAFVQLGSPAPYFARRAFEVADAMLAEREK